MAIIGDSVRFLLAGLVDPDTGERLNGGKVWTYTAGTTTLKGVYTDKELTVSAANPVVLDINGVAQVYASGPYKFIVTDPDETDPLGVGNSFYVWDNLIFYSAFNLVDGNLSDLTLTAGAGESSDLELQGAGDGNSYASIILRETATNHFSFIAYRDSSENLDLGFFDGSTSFNVFRLTTDNKALMGFETAVGGSTTWGFSTDVAAGGEKLEIVSPDMTTMSAENATFWLERDYAQNSVPATDPAVPICMFLSHEHTGTGTAFTHSLMAYALNNGTGDNEAIAISGKARRRQGIGNSIGVWGKGIAEGGTTGWVTGLQGIISLNADIAGYNSGFDTKKGTDQFTAGLHIFVDSSATSGFNAAAGILIDANSGQNSRLWNGILMDKNIFPGASVAGTVGINLSSCDTSNNPQYGIKFGDAEKHIYGTGDITIEGAGDMRVASNGNTWLFKSDNAATEIGFRKGSIGSSTSLFGIDNDGNVNLFDGGNITTGTVTGTIIGTTTSNLIGFWTATPVNQPTTGIGAAAFVANTSAINDDTATFGGYTLGQIAAALQEIGLLA